MKRTSEMPITSDPPRKKTNAPSSAQIDARVRAVRRKRVRRRLPRLLWAIPLGLVFVALCAMMTANYSQFRRYQRQADFKATQLASLRETQSSLEHRLDFLQLPKGRLQILAEHGFVKNGQRYLQFPEENTTRQTSTDAASSERSSTRMLETPPLTDKDDGGSAWQRMESTFSGWMNGLRGAKTPQP